MTVGGADYLFFVLYEDYNDLQRSFVQEFNVHLERLARELKHGSAVIKPFPGDIEATRRDVLNLGWTEDEIREVCKVPSLLLIRCQFGDFSPRRDPWMIFHFGEARFGDHRGLSELDQTLRAIAASTKDGAQADLFELANELAKSRPDGWKIFQAQPGAFGFSIDLVEAGRQLRERLTARRRVVGRE